MQAPWLWAMTELRSVQHNLEMLRSRVDGVEALRDMRELREGQEALSTRVRSVEECVTMHHVREFTHRIIMIEERIGVSGGVIGETLRECQMRLDQCAAGLANLDTRMRNQEWSHWYHDVSERESDEEIHQVIDERPRTRRTAQQRRAAAKARALNGTPLRHEPGLEQLQRDTQSQGPDENTIHQRITRFLAEHQRREANQKRQPENRLDSL